MATIKNPMNSDNPWNAGFSNLGIALFGDPSSASGKNAALDIYRQAETDKTYDEINRKLRGDTALQKYATTMQSLFDVPAGQQFDQTRVMSAMKDATAQLILSGGDPKDAAQLLNIGASYGSQDPNMRRAALNALGIDPGLDYAATQQEAEAIARNKPVTLSPNQTLVVPPSRFAGQPTQTAAAAAPTGQPTSMADTIAPQTASFTTEKLAPLPMRHQAPEIYNQYILDSASRHGVPPEILTELLWRESKFNLGAKGAAGERGLAQAMTDTAASPGYGVNMPGYVPGVDPADDIEFGAQYLAGLKKQYGTWDAALTAYNWGSGNLEDYGIGGRPAATTDYVTEILTNAGYMPGPGQPTQTAAQSPEAATQPAAGGPQQTQVAQAPAQPMQNVFGPEGGTVTAPPASQEEVSSGASIMRIGPDGKPYTYYTAPKVPDVVGGGATTKVGQPSIQEETAINSNVATLIGAPDAGSMVDALGLDGYAAYTRVVDEAWNASNGNIAAATAAGAKYLRDNYDVTAPVDRSWWNPRPDEPMKMTPHAAPTTAAPAAPAEATTATMPAAQDRIVGQVYDTPAHGPLRWTGVPGAEWEEP